MIRIGPGAAIVLIGIALTGILLGAGAMVRAGAVRPPVIAVAVEGDPAPDTGGATMKLCGAGGYSGSTFDEPMTNAGGDVMFWTCLSDGGWALYLKLDNGPLTLIARSGQSIDGVGMLPARSEDLGFTDGPAINDAGTSIFAIREGITDGTIDSALFMKMKSGSLQAVLRAGDPTPCGGSFLSFDDMSLNNNDDVAIIATYEDTATKAGAFLRLADGSVEAIICNGEALPGTGMPNETFAGTDGDSLDGPWLNDERTVVFAADAITGPTTTDEDEGVISIWTGSTFVKRYGEKVQSFVMIGDPIPASVGGGVVHGLGVGRPAFNNSNVLGFNLSRETSTPSHPAEQFIASKALGGPIVICREDLTPAPEGGFFEGFSAVAMNQDGDLQFTADIDFDPMPDEDDTDNSRGIFTCNDGALKTIVLQTDDGKPGGGTWSYELEEGSIGSRFVVFMDEVNFTDPSSERGVFRAGELNPPPTPTPSPTPAPKLIKGNVDCDEDVDSVDGLKLLRHVAALTVSQEEPCPDIGTNVASIWGDVDCDDDVDSVDSLKVLRHVAALSVSQNEPCSDIGVAKGG